MKNPLRIILGLSFTALVTFTGCHKNETTEVDNETQSAVDNAVADQEYMAIVPATNSHAINTKGTGAQNRTMALCDTLTQISGDTLWGLPGHISDATYTMNISNAACARTLADGRFRTGSLWVRLTGRIRNAGSKMIIKLLNYKAGTVTYSCDSMVVTTVASNTLYTTFNITLTNGLCKGSIFNPWTIKYSLNRTITVYPRGLNGSGTSAVTYIYGTASGTNRTGRDFTVDIPVGSPLVKIASCEYISSGVMSLTPKDFATRTIDFGYSIAPAPNGGCDEDASFTVNNNTVAFKLK